VCYTLKISKFLPVLGRVKHAHVIEDAQLATRLNKIKMFDNIIINPILPMQIKV